MIWSSSSRPSDSKSRMQTLCDGFVSRARPFKSRYRPAPLIKYFLMTPKKKARVSVKAKVRDIVRRGGATPMPELMKRINATVGGWVNYFRVGNSSRAFSEVRAYVEMKVRTLLTRRKRRRKSSVGWRRWSNEYLYGVLGLYWDWKIRPLPGVENLP